MRRGWSWAAIAGTYLTAAAIMLAPLCNLSALGTASFGGDSRLIIWTLAWDNHALVDRAPALFDANIFYPAPSALAYSEHLFGISLFTLPIYAATRNPVLAYNLVWILSFLLMAASAHLLAWRTTRDHLASTVAGLAAAFCFYRMHQGHGHLHMIWSWGIPLSLVALDRWVERRTWRSVSLVVVVILLQALASWYQAVLILAADLLYFVWLIAMDRSDRRRLAALLLQGTVGAGIVAAAVWPFARHYHVLAAGSPAEAAAESADAAACLVPPQNTLIGRWLIAHGSHAPRQIWGELTLFLGWIPAALAVAAAIAAFRRSDAASRRHRFWVALAAVALALSLGPSRFEVARNAWGWTPFGLLMHVPGVNLFRVPARFTELVTLAIAMLAAVACAGLHARFGRRAAIATACLIPLFLAESYVVDFPGGAPAPFPIPAVYRLVANLPPGAVVSLPDRAASQFPFEEADFEYFSTAHWHRIANGYSRGEPPQFRPLMEQLKPFPAAASAEALRGTGIRYVVVHARDYRERGPSVLAAARDSSDFRLLASAGDIFLFEVREAAGASGRP